MVDIQLYIEGSQVELFKDESITLTQSIQDIKDISKIFTDFTRTFNVPASKNNNKIFKHFHRFNIVGFDARTKKNAEIYLNYKPFKDGKIKLEGVQLKNNEPHTYRITFYGNIINLKDTLGEDKISGLKHLNYFNFDYNDTNITAYMSIGKDVDFFTEEILDAIIFPLITTQSRLIFDNNTIVNTATTKNIAPFLAASANYGVPISELKPAIRVYAVIKAIESHYGNLKFSSDFFNTTNLSFYSLYLWLHNKEGKLFANENAQYPITNLTASIVGDRSDISGFTDASFVNKFTNETKARYLKINVTPSGNALYNVIIKQDGENFTTFNDLTGTTTNSVTSGKVEWLEIPQGTYTFFIETQTASSYDIDISIQERRGGLNSRKDITSNSGVAAFVSDKNINISSLMPNMLVIELLQGLFKLFNLTAFQNRDGIIEIKPLEDFFLSSSKTWDITKDLDKTQSTVDTILPFKEVNFKYKSTSSFLANNFKERANREWGSMSYASGDKFDGQSYNIEVPFEHFLFERLFVTDNLALTETQSDIQYGYSVDKDQQPYLGEPLLFYAVKSFGSISALNLAESAKVTIGSPYMPSNSISTFGIFGTGSINLNFHAEYDEYTGVSNEETLFKTQYESYIKDMFDTRKRLTTVKAFLPMSMIYNLSLADKIIVFDDIYRINKLVTNFENNQSTIELNNIFEVADEKELTLIAGQSITVDSILNFADTTFLTADATGRNSGFSIPSFTTVIPNTIPINNPKPAYVNVPLVVVAPTIAPSQIIAPTNTKVFFNYQVTALGTVGGTLQQMQEYGFLYSTTKTNLTASNDVDVLKAASGVTSVPFVRDQLSLYTLPTSAAGYEKSGLTHPAIYYWRFYARTNTGSVFAFADAISDVQTAATVAVAQGQYNNGNGQNLYGINGTSGYMNSTAPQHNISKGNFTSYGAENQDGFIIGNIISPNETAVKEIIEWLTSTANPTPGTYYPVSHTMKTINRFGADNSAAFNMSSKTNAFAKYVMYLNAYPIVMIKGGTITGSLAAGSIGGIGLSLNTQDLQSTS